MLDRSKLLLGLYSVPAKLYTDEAIAQLKGLDPDYIMLVFPEQSIVSLCEKYNINIFISGRGNLVWNSGMAENPAYMTSDICPAIWSGGDAKTAGEFHKAMTPAMMADLPKYLDSPIICGDFLVDEPSSLDFKDIIPQESLICLKNPPAGNMVRGCIASFQLSNTLSENGYVSRGICSDDGNGHLAKVVENTKIYRREDGQVVSLMDDGSEVILTGNEPASMNSWGFMPEMVNELEALFCGFLEKSGQELKSEFYLPFVVDSLINAGKAEITMLHSRDSWFGVTYKEDRPSVQEALRKLVASGAYPEKLF